MQAFKTEELVDKTGNEVNVLYPTRSKYGVWSFTDLSVGLWQEPFVGDINTMIDMFVTDDKGVIAEECVVYISENPLPKASGHLIKQEEEQQGSGWYELEGTGIVGWLCPATFKYFKGYPQDIYFRVDSVNLNPKKK